MRFGIDRLTVKLPFSLDHKSATVKLGSSHNSVINKNWGVEGLRRLSVVHFLALDWFNWFCS